MKNDNTFKTRLLISSIFFSFIFFSIQLLLKYFKLIDYDIWPAIVIQSITSAVIWFFLMFYWMKRKFKNQSDKQNELEFTITIPSNSPSILEFSKHVLLNQQFHHKLNP